jgi:spore coat protein U-like protein
MRRPPLIRSVLAALVLALACVGSAQAKTCNVSAAWTSFGAYDPVSAVEVLTIGSVTVHCDENCNAVLSLSVGNGAGAKYSTGRKMTRTRGGGTLTYNLYADSSRNLVFGDGSGGSVTHDISGKKNRDVTQDVWARIPAGQRSVLAGDYIDIVMVTISY